MFHIVNNVYGFYVDITATKFLSFQEDMYNLKIKFRSSLVNVVEQHQPHNIKHITVQHPPSFLKVCLHYETHQRLSLIGIESIQLYFTFLGINVKIPTLKYNTTMVLVIPAKIAKVYKKQRFCAIVRLLQRICLDKYNNEYVRNKKFFIDKNFYFFLEHVQDSNVLVIILSNGSPLSTKMPQILKNVILTEKCFKIPNNGIIWNIFIIVLKYFKRPCNITYMPSNQSNPNKIDDISSPFTNRYNRKQEGHFVWFLLFM